MVRESPCKTRALGFSGTHQRKYAVRGPELGMIGDRVDQGIPPYFKGPSGLAHSIL